MRVDSANTTTELRKKGFNIVVAPGRDGKASGSLYLDEGISIEQPSTSEITFEHGDGSFKMDGSFGYAAGVDVETIAVLGYRAMPKSVKIVGGNYPDFDYENARETLRIQVRVPLTGPMELSIE